MVLLSHLENVLHISEKNFTTIPVVPGEKKASLPYLVNVTIPVEGYDPVVFTLGKHCGTRIQLWPENVSFQLGPEVLSSPV
jgi:hypothetical protein